MFVPVMEVGWNNASKIITVTATFIRLQTYTLTMKRGAERQLTRDEFEDGDVEREVRLAIPDEKRLTHLSHSQRWMWRVSKRLPTKS